MAAIFVMRPQPLPPPPSTRATGPPGLLPPRPQTAQWTRSEGPPRREARAHGNGKREAVGAQTPPPLVACCLPSQPGLLKPADGAHGQQNSWFGRIVVGSSLSMI